jgi:hypothetical protein
MKWYNEDRTTMVDTTSINYYHYDVHNKFLSLVINGHSVLLGGQEALELLDRLKNPLLKQLLTEGEQ